MCDENSLKLDFQVLRSRPKPQPQAQISPEEFSEEGKFFTDTWDIWNTGGGGCCRKHKFHGR